MLIGSVLERQSGSDNDSTGLAMMSGKRVAVVLPAYNAERTLDQTYQEIPHHLVDDVILVDDASTDHTLSTAAALGIHTIQHEKNRGYGGNQKTCYDTALERGADIVIMLHPDYQYSPRLIEAMVAMLCSGHYDAVLASRILGKGARIGGMPLYKYVANRILTAIENILINEKFSEYHTGYRGWTREVLEALNLDVCSNDFVFDNQMLVKVVHHKFRIGEISCPTKYFPEASSINVHRSIVYGFGVLETALRYRLHVSGIVRSKLFAVD